MWLFFDLGSTLLNPERFVKLLDDFVFGSIRSFRDDVSYGEYARVRDLTVSQGSGRIRSYRDTVEKVLRSFLREDEVVEVMEDYSSRVAPHYYDLIQPFPDVKPSLELISQRHRCGLIANQRRAVKDFLDGVWRLSEFFSVEAISDFVGFSKPDKRIFIHALSKAGCRPEEAVMLGDRPDMDIAPARRLGMHTIRVDRGVFFSRVEPRGVDELAELEVADLRPVALLVAGSKPTGLGALGLAETLLTSA